MSSEHLRRITIQTWRQDNLAGLHEQLEVHTNPDSRSYDGETHRMATEQGVSELLDFVAGHLTRPLLSLTHKQMRAIDLGKVNYVYIEYLPGSMEAFQPEVKIRVVHTGLTGEIVSVI